MHKKQAYTILTAIFVFIVLVILAIQLITIYNSKPKIIDVNVQPDLDRLDKAINTTNINVCNTIKHNSIKSECYAEVSILLKDISSCNKALNETQSYCKATIAINNLNLSQCSLVSENDYWWDNCNANIALNSMNFNGCYEVRNRDQRNNCFYDIALNRSSLGECFQIRFSELQQRCVYQIATNNLNPEQCDFMNDGINKYQCYQKIAKTLRNSSICDNIESKQFRQMCMNSTLSVESS